MKVDYGWIQVILNGNLSFVQYNTDGAQANTATAGRIGWIDLTFNVNADLNYPYFILSDVEDAGNGGNYFTYGVAPSGPFTSTLTIDTAVIAKNSTLRIYVKTVDNYNETKHVKATLKLTPAGNWKPPTWMSGVYGYDLYALPATAYNIRYYDSNGVERAASDINNYRIGFFDITMALPHSFPNANITITDTEPASNNGNYFQYSFTNGSGYTDSLSWTAATINNGDTRRVYVSFNDNGSGWRRVTANLNVAATIAGLSRNQTSATYGATISQGFGIAYYDNTGTQRSAGDINNYTIGFMDLTFPISDASPSNTFYISDSEPGSNGGNFFQYSFDNASWVDNLQISNVLSKRVYVRFTDPQTGARRVTSQLVVSGTNLGQQVSAVYGGNISIQPWLTVPPVTIVGDMTPDDSGYCYFNMRTGHCRVSVSQGGGSKAGTFYINSEQWVTGLAYPGDSDNYNVQIPVEKDFPAAANPYIAGASNLSATLAAHTGRNQISITQQPSAANDYTIILYIKDPSNGPGHYTFTITTNYN